MAEPIPKLFSPVGDEHFRAFGAIVHMFARHEFLMIGIISVITKLPVHQAAMLMAELPYRGKRETLLAMIKLTRPAIQVEKISGYLGELHKWNQLRNAIAHCIWVDGARPNTIKAMSMSVRGGSADFKGIDDEEPEYTAKDLVSAATQLVNLHSRFKEYLFAERLIPIARADD